MHGGSQQFDDVETMGSAEFIMGTVSGAVLLLIGIAVGWWVGRQSRVDHPSDSLDARQTLRMLGGLSQWADDLVGDVSRHRELVTQVSSKLDDLRQQSEPDENANSVNLLSEIISANESLQARLDDAESTLQAQAEQVAHSLTEARTDGLTELMNRRALDDELRNQIASSREKGLTFSIGLIDVDYFKGLNDQYGHLAGDEVLKRVGRILTESTHREDVVTRFGGDEFAIVFPGTSPTSPAEALEQIRWRIDAANIKFDNQALNISVSCGCAKLVEGEAPADVMQRADEALYAAKQSGRNVAFQHDGHECRRIPSATAGNSKVDSLATSPKLSQACNDLKQRLMEVAQDRPAQLQ